jgi:hypothetical protein
MSVSTLDVITASSDVAVMVSLVILAIQIYFQRREMKYSTYEKLMSDFSATASLLIDHPEVLDITMKGSAPPEKWGKYSENEKKAYYYFDSLLGLFERVYFARKEIKLPQEEWERWRRWIEYLKTNDIFMDVFNDNIELYDSGFTDEINNSVKTIGTK